MLADANRQASVLRGEGDAEATRLFAEAVADNVDFYTFQRGLEALKRTFKEGARVVLTPEDDLLKPMIPAADLP